jgi:hypothetical protein
VRLTPIALDGADDLSDVLPGLSDGREQLEARPPEFDKVFEGSASPSATDRMIAVLAWRYWQTRGELPPSGAWSRFDFNGHEAYALAVSTPRRSNTHRVAWALRLSDEHAMLLELTATPESTPRVYAAARLLAAALTADAEPASSESSP